MKICKAEYKGIGRFNGVVRIPFDQLRDDDRLIALTGTNGAGKTTSIETIPGTVHLETPSRGPLVGLAKDKDSYSDITIKTDQKYRMLLKMNGIAKKPTQTAYVYDENGNPLTQGKINDYKKQIAKIFPSNDVYKASAFASQTGNGNFASLSVSKRKELFIRMLGQSRLQSLSDNASDREKQERDKATNLQGKISGLKAVIQDECNVTSNLEIEKRELEKLGEEIQKAKQEREDYESALKTWKEKRQEIDKAILETHHKVEKTGDELRHLERYIKDTKDELEQEKSYLSVLEAKEKELPGLEVEVGEKYKYEVELESLRSERKELDEKLESYNAEYEAWVDEGRELKEELITAKNNWTSKTENVKQLISSIQSNIYRLSKTASIADEAACKNNDGFGYPQCKLIANSIESQQEIKDLEQKKTDATELLKELEKTPTQVVDLQFRLDKLRKQKPEKPLSNSYNVLTASIGRVERKLLEIKEKQNRILLIAADIKMIDKVKNDIAVNESGLDNLEIEFKDITDKAEQGKLGLKQLTDSLDVVDNEKPLESNLNIQVKESNKDYLIQVISKLEQQLETINNANQEIEKLQAELDETTYNMEDWKHLKTAFGKQGIQALEIDEAGPEVSDLINDLLHSCYGSRFTVELKTTELKADGKGHKEIFDLWVIDSELGWEGSISMLSGGEKVLVEEALGLAIAIYNTNKSDIPMYDLFRDECSGALAVNVAPLYPIMLRKAIELGGFHRCYFICHQPELWALADRRFIFEDNQIILD